MPLHPRRALHLLGAVMLLSVTPPADLQAQGVQSLPPTSARQTHTLADPGLIGQTRPAPLSRVTLPLLLPLGSLRLAAAQGLPQTLAEFAQDQDLLGGLVRVKLTGRVLRRGDPVLTPDGDSLVVQLPIAAALHVAPSVGEALARDVSGQATVKLRLTPVLNSDWTAGVKVASDYTWTDPLSFEVVSGVRLNVQGLADAQIRSQLGRLEGQLTKAIASTLKLRSQAEAVWARLGQPWTLPGPQPAPLPAYALIRGRSLSISPPRFTAAGLELTLAASFEARAGLGAVPAATASPPLPALTILPPSPPEVQLSLPLALPYPQLSALATRTAAGRPYTLPVPLRPVITVQGVTLSGQGERLSAAVRLSIRALGLSVGATVDVSGVPKLSGSVLSLSSVQVQTRRAGLSSRLLGWLADRRAQEYLAQQASFDLSAPLEGARAAIQRQLPYRPAPGVTLDGRVGRLEVLGVQVKPGELQVQAALRGELDARLEPETK